MKITLVENTFCNLQSVGNSLGKSYTKPENSSSKQTNNSSEPLMHINSQWIKQFCALAIFGNVSGWTFSYPIGSISNVIKFFYLWPTADQINHWRTVLDSISLCLCSRPAFELCVKEVCLFGCWFKETLEKSRETFWMTCALIPFVPVLLAISPNVARFS